MLPYIITTERLGLRRWIDADTQAFIKMNKDVEVMKYFPKLLTELETIEMLNRVNLHFSEHNFGLYAVEEKLTSRFIGFTGFAIPTFSSFFTPCVEIGWRYTRGAWGKGYATEAAKACLNYGFESLNFDKVVSFTAVINTKSEKIMQKIGMTYVTNFDHPKVARDSILCPHVLYQVSNERFKSI